MDVRPDQLIDVSLTAAELLIAGLLGTLLFSLRRRRVQSRNTQTDAPTSLAAATPTGEPSRADSSRIEFVSFGVPSGADSERIDTALPLSETRRRNRADIIRQARQMIERGAATRDITQALRMTDGEIALLRQDINR